MDFEQTNKMDFAFRVEQPTQQTAPFLFNSPHSGRCYSDPFKQSSKLTAHELRQSEDAFVDLLFSKVSTHGAPLMAAHFPRAYIDLNREPYELDQRMFADQLPAFAKTQGVRVGSGLGTIARIVAEKQEIYNRKLTVQEGLERIDTLYKPYHQTLRKIMAQNYVSYGYSCLIDCHSMPSRVLRFHKPDSRPDIILGDRYGTSCHPELTQISMDLLTALGFKAELNKPYAGGFITQHYGRPAKGLHALQIEIDRSLYMNEQTMQPNSDFPHLVDLFGKFSNQLMEATADIFRPLQAAAQ